MKLKSVFLVFITTGLIIGCSKAQEKPRYLSFKYEKDSLKVWVHNGFLCPMFLKFKKATDQEMHIVDFEGQESKQILAFPTTEMDSISILENYTFSGFWFGTSHLKSYDTLYNYALPFLKGKRYKVLQGQNTNHTHQGDFSRYAIDFKMNIGQTVCAMRGGLVVRVKDHNTKGGRGKKYYPYANLIIIYHEDGTFAQYVHLKHKGSLVKAGDTVKKGQPIGFSGNTGQSSGPHLHFAVYKPTATGLVSIPYILDSIPSERYTKGNYAVNN
jgi:murein DD-endopeptidase MepM/ murein hydrolase activator NlpD